MSPHDALERLQHGFDGNRVVEHGERSVAEGVGEVAGALGGVDLARADDDRRRRLLEPLEELEDARTRGDGATGRLLGSGDGVHRDREVDHGDVHMLAADELGGLVAALGAEAADADPVEDQRELVGEGVLAPAAVGQEKVEALAGLPAGTRTLIATTAAGTRRLVVVGGVEAEVHEDERAAKRLTTARFGGAPAMQRSCQGLRGSLTGQACARRGRRSDA